MDKSVRRTTNPIVYANKHDVDKLEDWWYTRWSYNINIPELLNISYLGVVQGVKYDRLILAKPKCDGGEDDNRD